jgi:signal transduction histidine kinase/CheY-like chemotaxis protein
MTDAPDMRATGLPTVDNVSWGTHLCQFYRTRDDLADTVVPFFRAGLEGNERCLWVTCEPFVAADARATLARAVPDLEERVARGQIEILDQSEWYTRNGKMGARDVLQAWLTREKEARRSGYEGLRISGNTFWLSARDWAGFSEYEAIVHESFHGRRILALCSYSLDKCGPDEIIDVLRNHRFALVRRENRWEAIQSATFMLAAMDADASAHAVRFFHDDELPVERIVRHLGKGRPIVIATPPHQVRIRDAMQPAQAAASVFLDAEDIASRVVVDGRASKPVFDALVGAVVTQVCATPGPVRGYGEIVDVLSRRGQPDAALDLERWWNELLAGRSMELLCGYSLQSFADSASTEVFQHICETHAHVEPAANGIPKLDPRRIAVELQQARAALQHEVALRRMVESRLARLQELTSSLSEAASLDEIAAVAARQLAEVFGADHATLLVPTGDGLQLRMFGHRDVARRVLDESLTTPIDAPLPANTVFRTGRPIWLGTRGALLAEFPEVAAAVPDAQGVACIPLLVTGRRLGVITLLFRGPREVPAVERALIEDYAKQLALALDRAILYERAQTERERAEAANRAKDEFLAMLGHELRNPLSPILTAVQLMRLRAGDALTRERTIIERQVNHMVRLVDDLLDVSRITRGKVQLKRLPIDLARVVAQAIEIASPLLEERAHRLTTTVPAGLMVDVDANRLAQVLANLLTNAAKYTPPRGTIEVTGTARQGRVVLSVRDNGVGIEPELLPRIFELFVQGKQSTDRAQGGLGLGLAIARSLIEMHDGSLGVRSEGLGRGSEFVVELPRAEGVQAPTLTLAAASGPSAPARAGSKVLVIDDNRDAATILAEALESVGHHVRVAHDGPSALEIANEFQPHLALVDLGLPIMDGFELAKRLQELGRETKLVAVTGYGQESDRRRTLEAGFARHFVKPVDLDKLDEVIRALCAVA